MTGELRTITIIAVALLFLGCMQQPTSTVGTSGSETGNARVAGIILGPGEQPSYGTTVHLLPADFNPIRDRLADVPSGTTDADGSFSIGVDKETDTLFNLYAVDRKNSLQVLKLGLELHEDTAFLKKSVLRNAAQVTIVFSEAQAALSGALYIEGTPIKADKNSGTRTVTAAGIPAGVIPSAILVSSGGTSVVADTMHTIEKDSAAGTALLVIESVSLLPSERLLLERLVDSLKFRTTLIADENFVAADADSVDVVVVASSASSSVLLTSLKGVATPVVVSEENLYHRMGMVAGVSNSGDFGDRTTVIITDKQHAVATGLGDTVRVTDETSTFGWAIPGAEARIVAVDFLRPGRALVFCYEAGSLLTDGTRAPARRAGLFMNRDATRNLNAMGWLLFDNTVVWAAQ
jgi:hypothetical protein